MRRILLCLLLLAMILPASAPVGASMDSQALPPIPANFDWREVNAVTPVRSQGGCSAAHAFAATAMLESALILAGGPRVDLSEQYLLNCNDRAYTCDGAGGWDILDFYRDAYIAPNTEPGAVLESAVPYRGQVAACARAAAHPYRIERWQSISPEQASVEEIQRAVLAYGPVGMGVCAWSRFMNYTGGIFEYNESAQCEAHSRHTNHAVTVVGWSNTGGYWIVKNSWGASWGDGGYMLLRYGVSNAGYDSVYLVYAAPPPATALTAPAAGALLPLTGARLAWKPVAGAQMYQAQIAADAAFSAQLLDVQTADTGLDLTGLPSNTSLFARVRVCRAVDDLPRCSAWSAPRSFKTRPQPPSLDFPGADAALDSLRPEFRWHQPDSAARFDLQIAADEGFSAVLRSAAVTGTVYAPGSDLPREKLLFWRARAWGLYGVGAWSAPRAFTTPNPPAAPKLLSPASGALLPAGSTPELAWSVPAGAQGFRLEYAHSQLFDEVLLQIDMDEAAYLLGPLAPDALHYWRVRAVGQGGALSNWSALRVIKTRPEAPTALLPVDGATLTTLRPDFSWQGAAPRYEVQIARNAGCAALLRSARLTAAHYTPATNLPRAAALSWRVRAVGRFGVSPWSICPSFTTPP